MPPIGLSIFGRQWSREFGICGSLLYRERQKKCRKWVRRYIVNSWYSSAYTHTHTHFGNELDYLHFYKSYCHFP
jgi:hypothetical protein